MLKELKKRLSSTTRNTTNIKSYYETSRRVRANRLTVCHSNCNKYGINATEVYSNKLESITNDANAIVEKLQKELEDVKNQNLKIVEEIDDLQQINNS